MSTSLRTQPGLRDVAEQLSLSVWTVSKALSGQAGVKESTRQRIIQAADAMGYVPNRQAQLLRQKRTRCIGVLLPSLTNPIYSQRMADVYEAAEEHEYEILVTSYEKSLARQERLCRELIGRRVEAIILDGGLKKELLDRLIDANIVVLLINSGEWRMPTAAQLRVDVSQGVRKLYEHLIEMGHRKPLLVGHWTTDSRRMRGIDAALKQAGFPPDDYLTTSGIIQDQWFEKGYELTREHFERNREVATVVMASNDLIGIGAVAALTDLGLKVPEDVSVTGIDNITASRFSRPALTTVSQTHLHLGRRAVEMVISILEGDNPRNISEVLTPELVIRDSTGPARTLFHERSTSCVA